MNGEENPVPTPETLEEGGVADDQQQANSSPKPHRRKTAPDLETHNSAESTLEECDAFRV